MVVTVLGIVVCLQPTIKVLVAVSMIALQLLRESYTWLLLSTMMLLSSSQPANAYLLIAVTEPGMTKFVRPTHPLNALEPIVDIELGMTKFVRPTHPQKA